MEINNDMKEVIEIIWEAIKNSRLIKFYYESISNNNKDFRIIEPYIVGKYTTGNKNIYLSGLPYDDFEKKIKRTQQGQYLIGTINPHKLEILRDTFEEPDVERKQLDSTPNVEIICRFIYADEDRQEVMKSWVKIDGLDLT
jgi:hypothetical protein